MAQPVPALRQIRIDVAGIPGRLFYFTSSVEPNFLCLGTVPPDSAFPAAQFWILHRDRLEAIERPADFKPSPNWLANAAGDRTGRQSSHDPRRSCDFELWFSGYHLRRPVLTLLRLPGDSDGWLARRDSYTGKSRLVVRRTGAATPSLVLERFEWNVETHGAIADAAHYDQAFGILVVPTRIAGQAFLLVLDVNDLNATGN